jgi:4'-phosphopantetheinyl transferase
MPLLYIKNLDDTTRLGIWKVEETIDELQAQLMLNQQELDFFSTLKKGKRNLHWLAGRVMIRTLLETSDFIQVKEDEFGKPYLPDFDYEISISHSYDYAGVMIGKHKVGIDIEKMKKDLMSLAPKFLSLPEINNLNPIDHSKQLYVNWCAKEALYKLYGKKELSFRHNIIIKGFDFSSKNMIQAEIRKDNFYKEFEVIYDEFVPGYMLAYVIDN